jgi:hypothetical protein
MRKTVVVVLLILILPTLGYSQQAYVGRFDGFGSYSTFSSPRLNLTARGFNGKFGVNATRWLAMGFDMSVFNGHTSLTTKQLNPAIGAQLAPLLSTLPAGTTVAVPYEARIYTYSAGPQINIRRLKLVTFFVRPALGALHADVTAKPNNALSTLLVNNLVGSSAKTKDTVVFYGVGGGIDWNVSTHFGIRTAADFVRMNMFDSLLDGPRNSIRVSIGPTIRFGGNVEK